MLHLFLTVFVVVFIAELPDKTALATVVLAARFGVGPVLVGACAGLLLQSAIAVGLGALLAKLPAHLVGVGSGAVFIGCGVYMWLRKAEEDEPHAGAAADAKFWRVARSVLVIIFVAELGDLTQITTATFAARHHGWQAWLVVFAASTLALWSVAVLAVLAGQRLAKLVDPAKLLRAAALLFVTIGLYLTVSGVVAFFHR